MGGRRPTLAARSYRLYLRGHVTGQTFYDFLVTSVTLLLAGYGLFFLVRWLKRGRPGFAIGPAIAAAFGVRVLCAGAVSLTSIGTSLRGDDEAGFIFHGHEISSTPFLSGDWTHAALHDLPDFVFAIQIWALDSPEFALRVTQVGLAVAGLALLAAAAYELAGPRAAFLSAWILALEPTNIFFSSLLHKEPNMFLATGLVVFGGSLIWRRAQMRYLLLVGLGCLIAAATRNYASWFLIAAGAAITLHASLRYQNRGSVRSFGLLALVVLLVAAAAPVVASRSGSTLSDLQKSQNANATDQSNLALEQVDYSSGTGVLTNLPQRMFDVAFRPFPWQLGNPSQQIGVMGTMVAYATLFVLLALALGSRSGIVDRGGPILYTLLFLFIAYSLSAGNAGTAFRYRSHLVVLGILLAVVVWVGRRQQLQADDMRPLRDKSIRTPELVTS